MNQNNQHKTSTLIILGLLFSFAISAMANTAKDPNQLFQSIIHNLDYISVDYAGIVISGEIHDQAEYDEQLEIANHAILLLNTLPDNPEKASLINQGKAILSEIIQKSDSNIINTLCRNTIAALTRIYQVKNIPTLLPSIAEGSRLYQENCVSCHGENGFGDGVNAAELTPKPANFHDRSRQQHRNIYALYNVISLGADGTAMPAFTKLKADQRWALAFYISNYFASDNEIKLGQELWYNNQFRDALGSLQKLTQAKPADISAELGENGLAVLAYLRANPQELSETTPNPLAISRAALTQSISAFKKGDIQQAYNYALTAYVDGFEKVEARLRVADSDLRLLIERKMLEFRSKIKNEPGLIQLEADQSYLLKMLDEADTALNAPIASPSVTFFSAMVILLREGLEAILVLAAIITVLIKSNRRDALRYIHMGWVGALLFGLFTWYIANHFIAISGAQRELTEGVTALIAAGMLLYVGFWLHDQSQALRWQQYVHQKLSTTLTGGTIWGLVFIAFIAVYREIFESILFYQSLMLSMQPAQHQFIYFGIVAAIAALLVLGVLIMRYSVRLPLRKFFSFNMWLMFILAIVFAGKGVAALQEANTLPSNPVNFLQIDILGIYPNLESLGLQVTLIFIALAWHSLRYFKGGDQLSK